jgi:hypothetical protein
MFHGIKLWFTDRNYYYQRKRYMKLQNEYCKKLTKQAKEFCPWSGYYMHKMIKTMLEFYYKTYEAKDCCWSESAWNGKVAESLKKAVDAANDLDSIDDLEFSELIAIAQKDKAFEKYIADWETKVNATINDSNNKEALLSGLAEEYLVEKYTKALYNIIGNHIWEWMD